MGLVAHSDKQYMLVYGSTRIKLSNFGAGEASKAVSTLEADQLKGIEPKSGSFRETRQFRDTRYIPKDQDRIPIVQASTPIMIKNISYYDNNKTSLGVLRSSELYGPF